MSVEILERMSAAKQRARGMVALAKSADEKKSPALSRRRRIVHAIKLPAIRKWRQRVPSLRR
ncbi:MAG TPA: hypothetical protein PK988_08625, partial [Candidatus Sumerlaeota bacterium]|nr:hypothetical protein [Candidatus Sumerlaeota bacterium]